MVVKKQLTALFQSTSSASTLSETYEMALTQSQTMLKQQIPEEFHEKMLPPLNHFMKEYMQSAQDAVEADPDNLELCNPKSTAERILTAIQYGIKYGSGPSKYQFSISHSALRGTVEQEPDNNRIDFYKFGCDFFRPAMDLKNSQVLGMDNLEQAVQQIKNGDNVVLLANHQSEADPQVVSCCLEKVGLDDLAERMVYVAGHKVTTDALAIPFSMGRNLVCIHSKKHIDADPETKPMKQRENLKAMQGMLKLFKQGGCLLWVAPSGGRDRRDLNTGKVPIAPFDSKTVDMFRLMGNKSGVKTHFYTLAMVSYELCPPPDFVDAGTGELRNVRFTPVGIAMGKECDSVEGLENREEFCQHAESQCQKDYEKLLESLNMA